MNRVAKSIDSYVADVPASQRQTTVALIKVMREELDEVNERVQFGMAIFRDIVKTSSGSRSTSRSAAFMFPATSSATKRRRWAKSRKATCAFASSPSTASS
jgi:hypothetical protein